MAENQEQPRQDEPDDAEIGAPEDRDPVDALASLAAGAETAEDEQLRDEALHDILQPHEEVVPDAAAAAAEQLFGDPEATEQTSGLAKEFSTLSASRTSEARRAAARNATGEHYRRLMIPLLIVVGGLLVLLSIIAGIILAIPTGDGQHEARLDATMLQKHGPLVIALALPLAAILLGAAMYFRHELKKSKRPKA